MPKEISKIFLWYNYSKINAQLVSYSEREKFSLAHETSGQLILCIIFTTSLLLAWNRSPSCIYDLLLAVKTCNNFSVSLLSINFGKKLRSVPFEN